MYIRSWYSSGRSHSSWANPSSWLYIYVRVLLRMGAFSMRSPVLYLEGLSQMSQKEINYVYMHIIYTKVTTLLLHKVYKTLHYTSTCPVPAFQQPRPLASWKVLLYTYRESRTSTCPSISAAHTSGEPSPPPTPRPKVPQADIVQPSPPSQAPRWGAPAERDLRRKGGGVYPLAVPRPI